MGQIYCGLDWAEAHHDIAIIDEQGTLVVKRRISDAAEGLSTLAERTAASEFIAVDIGIETDAAYASDAKS